MTCERCHREFRPKSKYAVGQKYCGNKCRLKAMRGLNERAFQRDREVREEESFGQIRWKNEELA